MAKQAEYTITEAAEHLKIAERTIYGYLNKDTSAGPLFGRYDERLKRWFVSEKELASIPRRGRGRPAKTAE